LYLIKTLKSNIPLIPKTIMIYDFKQNAILAFKENFPNIISRSCQFHLIQWVWAVWQTIQLIPTMDEKYVTVGEFCIQIQILLALA